MHFPRGGPYPPHLPCSTNLPLYNFTDTSGSAQAHKGILYIFDIFGFSSQTLQGADILATGGGGGGDDYLVVMPDFFEGATMQQEWFPTDTEEKKAKAQNFMAGPADISKAVPRAGKVMQELRVKYPHMEDWSAIGYCWGGKLLALTSQKGSSTGFKCGIQTSPGRLDPEDAKKIEIPMAVLASQGEGEEVVKKYEEALGGEKYVERFGDMVHGWMSAR